MHLLYSVVFRIVYIFKGLSWWLSNKDLPAMQESQETRV